MQSCENAGFPVSNHFREVTKMIEVRGKLRESEKQMSKILYERNKARKLKTC